MHPVQPAHILIVDDAPISLEVLLSILDPDYDVSIATSGEQALQQLQPPQALPDLILLDVMMPGLDGYQVCERLRADPRTRDIPVLFVTASTDAESETRALAAGGVDFIHKPVNAAVVRARVGMHLELQRRTRELQTRLAEIALAHEQLQVLWQAVEHSPTTIMIADRRANLVYVNSHFVRETGYTAAEVQGKNPRLLQSGLVSPEVYATMWQQLSQGQSWSGELINRRKNGETYWEEAQISPVLGDDGKVLRYVAVKLNITQRKEASERLAYMANHDALTDLPNRVLFFERVEQALRLAQRHQSALALMFLDLDKFKPVNDCYGHAVGDALLRQVAQRMVACVRAADTVGRVGGDEFVVLLQNVDSAEAAWGVAEKIRLALNEPFVLDGQSVSIAATIGLVVYPHHGSSADELTRHADLAMYRAKENGRNQVMLFQCDLAVPPPPAPPAPALAT